VTIGKGLRASFKRHHFSSNARRTATRVDHAPARSACARTGPCDAGQRMAGHLGTFGAPTQTWSLRIDKERSFVWCGVRCQVPQAAGSSFVRQSRLGGVMERKS